MEMVFITIFLTNIFYLLDFTVSDFSGKTYSQSIDAFQLPEGTQVLKAESDKPIKLLTKGEWKSFGTKLKVVVETTKTVIIMYSVNVILNGESLTVRVKLGKNYNKKSLMSVKGLTYGRGQGFANYILKKGTYKFDLEFKSECNLTYNVEPQSNNQHVSLTAILLE